MLAALRRLLVRVRRRVPEQQRRVLVQERLAGRPVALEPVARVAAELSSIPVKGITAEMGVMVILLISGEY
jgi:hypothetical protein